MESAILLKSTDHKRYENGYLVAGPHGGANRAIKLEPNPDDVDGTIVTIFNLDGQHPIWQDNVQMAPKQMKMLERSENKFIYRGYGTDSHGEPFNNYGLTIVFINGMVDSCILHMHDRNIDIEYLGVKVYNIDNNNDTHNTKSELEELSEKANSQFINRNVTDGEYLLKSIYTTIKNNPDQLKEASSLNSFGISFSIMVQEQIYNDIDILQIVSSLGYYCFSHEIYLRDKDYSIYNNRLLLLRIAHEYLKYTAISAFGFSTNLFGPAPTTSPDSKAEHSMFIMEFSDLIQVPSNSLLPINKDRKIKFNELIETGYFKDYQDVNDIIDNGTNYHKLLHKYIYDKIKYNDISNL